MQERESGALDSSETRQALVAAVNEALAALNQIDLALSATAAMQHRSDAAIWQALSDSEASLQSALRLSAEQVAAVAGGRSWRCDAGATAPLTVSLFGQLTGLRKGCRSLLLQVH